MSRSRGRPRSRRRAQPGSQSQEGIPRPLICRILASWWGGAAAFLGVVAALWALADASGEFRPTFPLPSEAAPVEFRVENKNPILNMTDATLFCDVESAAFDTDQGVIGFSFPVTSGAVNTAIPHRSAAHYPCDASAFISFPAGKLCLVGLCNDKLNISPSSVHLINETLQIGITYRILGRQLEDMSPQFTWDGHHWQEGPALH
jgi:hypothetical protein